MAGLKKSTKIILFVTLFLFIASSILLSMLAFIREKQHEKMQENRDNLEKVVTVENIILNRDYCEYLPQNLISEKGHDTIVQQYNTDVSIAYLNRDTTKTLYVFSSPIQYQIGNQFIAIDTRIKNTSSPMYEKQGYSYSVNSNDIKTYYSKIFDSEQGVLIRKNGFEYEILSSQNNAYASKYEAALMNFIGDNKSMVSYGSAASKNSQLLFYPSSLGTNCELKFSDDSMHKAMFALRVSSNQVKVRKEPGGYWVFYTKVKNVTGESTEEILGVIQTPLLKDANGNVSYNNRIRIHRQLNGLYMLEILFDKNVDLTDAVGYISFEMRREKQPDTAVYSKKPNLKYNYLKNYSLVGNNPDLGISRLMIRYKFVKDLFINADEVKSAIYYVYNLTPRENSTLEMLTILEDWCSLTGNWNNHYKTGDQITTINANSSVLKCDITNEVQMWCKDDTGDMEHNGVQLKAIEEQDGVYSILLSNDNALFKNVTEIILQ